MSDTEAAALLHELRQLDALYAVYDQSVKDSQMTQFELVGAFRHKMGLAISNNPHLLSPEDSSYFARFILEELSEYMRAVEEGVIVDAADAIVDMVYVALGCAHAMGLPFDELFDVVHQANMAKVPASNAQRSIRGNAHDVVKPIGWCPPEAEMLAIIKTKQSNAK